MTASTAPAAPSAPRNDRPILLRTGIVLAIVTALVSLPQAVLIGFDGSGWDVIVVAIAVFTVAIAVATLALAPFAWKGGRRAAIAIAALQIVALLPSLPAFILPIEEVGPGGVIGASVGVVIAVAIAVIILLGLRRRT